MADLALAVSQLSRRYDNRQILDHLDLSVAAGELVAIVGESGSGKSTLLNLIAGLDQPDAGRIMIAGRDLAALDDDARTRLRRAQLGFVFQSFHILPHLRVGQNIELPLVLLGLAAGERQQRVAELLGAVGLADRAGSLPRELSGGELQRVAVARALVHRPLLILADEPTGNLDAETAAMLMQLLATQIRARGAAGVLVTHSAAAAALADRVLVLDRGRLHPQDPAAH
ncbi:MAG: ABC transporter ATP-binding protein [Gammaproteobacteria bacterium]